MTISEKIPSRLELVPEFVANITNKVKHLLSEKELFNIRLSLEEALVNAIKHGNKQNPDLYVKVTVEADKDCISMKVVDEGAGYDFKALPNPTAEGNLHKASGRGIFLVQNLMDKVVFFDCGRGIEMIKFLKKGIKEGERENKRREIK